MKRPGSSGLIMAASAPLSLALREGTREAHRLAESMRFVRGFLRGTVDAVAYARLLTAHGHVYAALEDALDERGAHPAVAPLRLPGLARREALAADREFFSGTAGRGVGGGRPSAATLRYVARIEDVARTQPALLAAHGYVRYLGDLSGGQILGAIVRRTLGVRGREGVAFYDFGSEAERVGLKERYRAALDALPLTAEEREAVVREAVEVFRLNMDIFAEMEGNALRSGWRLLFPAAPRRVLQPA